MSRRLHFVGSLPPELSDDHRKAMSWVLDHAGEHELVSLPRDLDPNWVINYLRGLAEREAFEVRRPGSYDSYTDMRRYGVRRGHPLRPVDVSMGRAAAVREVLAEFRALRAARSDLAGTPLQVSVPNALDMALFAFAGRPLSALRYLRVFEQAVVDEVTELVAVDGADLLWQLESPSVLISMNMVRWLPGGPVVVARLLARQVGGLLCRFPTDAAVILHLCYGDYKHTEWFSPRSLAPAVAFLNRLAVVLDRAGRPLPPVHVPCAYGAHPAPTTERFYRPLRRLDRRWRLIAGNVSEADTEASATSLRLFEEAAGRPVYAVAAACGLGRRTPDQAAQAVDAMIATAASPTSTR